MAGTAWAIKIISRLIIKINVQKMSYSHVIKTTITGSHYREKGGGGSVGLELSTD